MPPNPPFLPPIFTTDRPAADRGLFSINRLLQQAVARGFTDVAQALVDLGGDPSRATDGRVASEDHRPAGLQPAWGPP